MEEIRQYIMKRFDQKSKDIILYAVFGVLTTGVNIVSYCLFAYVFRMGTMPSTVLAWLAAVMFAYMTNRKWVFHSQVQNGCSFLKEMIYFFTCRLLTGVVDLACMFLFVERLHMNDVLIKIIANIIVIILNYVASKYVIFKK